MKLKGYDLYMVRGDTETTTVRLIEDTSSGKVQRDFVDGDSIKMTIGIWAGDFTTPTVIKTIDGAIDTTTGTATITISPDDTAGMYFDPNYYVYDIQVTFADGTIKTLFPAARFVRGMEVSE